MSRSVDQFFANHKKLDIAYKLIHWSLATFILVIGFIPIMLVALSFLDASPILWLYGFKPEEIEWNKWKSRKEKMIYWCVILFLFALFLIVAGR